MRAYFIYPAMKVPVCPAFVVTSPKVVSLGAALYYTLQIIPPNSTILDTLHLPGRSARPARTLNREWTFVVGHPLFELAFKDLIYMFRGAHFRVSRTQIIESWTLFYCLV